MDTCAITPPWQHHSLLDLVFMTLSYVILLLQMKSVAAVEGKSLNHAGIAVVLTKEMDTSAITPPWQHYSLLDLVFMTLSYVVLLLQMKSVAAVERKSLNHAGIVVVLTKVMDTSAI